MDAAIGWWNVKPGTVEYEIVNEEADSARTFWADTDEELAVGQPVRVATALMWDCFTQRCVFVSPCRRELRLFDEPRGKAGHGWAFHVKRGALNAVEWTVGENGVVRISEPLPADAHENPMEYGLQVFPRYGVVFCPGVVRSFADGRVEVALIPPMGRNMKAACAVLGCNRTGGHDGRINVRV